MYNKLIHVTSEYLLYNNCTSLSADMWPCHRRGSGEEMNVRSLGTLVYTLGESRTGCRQDTDHGRQVTGTDLMDYDVGSCTTKMSEDSLIENVLADDCLATSTKLSTGRRRVRVRTRLVPGTAYTD